MSNPLEFEVLAVPDHASIKTSRSRRSIVTSLRSKTSRLFGRNLNDTNAAEEIPHPVQPSPAKSKRRWYNSVGTRFRRHDRTILESSDGSQDAHVELSTSPGAANFASPRMRSRSPSPISRRLFGRRRRVPSFPAQFRRPSASTFRRSSSSLSEKGKENLVDLADPIEPPTNASNTGSWSSFWSGVQRAVREMVDGNFSFSNAQSGRNTLAHPLNRPPLGTLWTIMSADSSDGGGGGGGSQTSPKMTASPLDETNNKNNNNNNLAPFRKSYRLSSWSPDWSPTSPTSPSYVVVSPSPSLTDKKTNGSICEEKEGSAVLSPVSSSSLPRLGGRITKEAPPPGCSHRSHGARGSEARLLAATGSNSVEVVEEEEEEEEGGEEDENSNGMMRAMEEMENRVEREIEAVGQLGQLGQTTGLGVLEEGERQARMKARVVSCPAGVV